MRICFLGDSFVNGTGDDEALGWVGRIVARARQRGRDVTAYNLGIRRDTSRDVALRWRSEANVRLPPEYDARLVFSFGANDCVSVGGAGGAPRVSHAESVAHAEAVLTEALRWLPTLMVGPSVLADDDDANARILALSADYENLCRRIGVPFLAIAAILHASPTWTNEAKAGDGVHPNRGGYTIVADAVDGWHPWRSWIDGAGEDPTA